MLNLSLAQWLNGKEGLAFLMFDVDGCKPTPQNPAPWLPARVRTRLMTAGSCNAAMDST